MSGCGLWENWRMIHTHWEVAMFRFFNFLPSTSLSFFLFLFSLIQLLFHFSSFLWKENEQILKERIDFLMRVWSEVTWEKIEGERRKKSGFVKWFKSQTKKRNWIDREFVTESSQKFCQKKMVKKWFRKTEDQKDEDERKREGKGWRERLMEWRWPLKIDFEWGRNGWRVTVTEYRIMWWINKYEIWLMQ